MQHAHQKAIIHRDLKPSNILVVEVDGKPTPRIIDFGLAKAMAPLVPGETLFTQMGAFLGTPGYMSPEQADPEVRDIDTRTDVYSLGAILYELLTGFLPFDATDWKKQRPEEYLAEVARGRSAATEHEGEHEPRDLDEQGGSARYEPKTTGQSAARRSGLDHDEGAGERSRAPVCDAVRTRRRYRELPAATGPSSRVRPVSAIARGNMCDGMQRAWP